MIDLDELEKLARAATPGPWASDFDPSWSEDCDGSEVVIVWGPSGEGFGRVAQGYNEYGKDNDHRTNADYIAAANPAAMLELIERVKRAEKELVVLREEMDKWKPFLNAHGLNFYSWQEGE